MAEQTGARAEADRYAQRALAELRRAWEQGWKSIHTIKNDHDLDALRSRSDFQAFLGSLADSTGKPAR